MNEDILFAVEQDTDTANPELEEIVDSKKFLIFITDEIKFGIDADYVVEILTNQSITYLPMLPDFIRGIINLRGQLVPIVDIRLRLGKAESEEYLVIVLNINGTQIGILVDSVDQMIDIRLSDILPSPAHSVQKLVSGICTLPDGSGTMMVFSCEQLLAHD